METAAEKSTGNASDMAPSLVCFAMETEANMPKSANNVDQVCL